MSPAFPAHWQVNAPVLIAETFSSKIWRVRREDGTTAIVKALKPFDDVGDELRGAHYLDWRGGRGAVRLLGFEGHDMLLEDAGDELLVQHLDTHGDRAATEIAAQVMAELFSRSERPLPPDFQPLRDRYASLFAKAKVDRDASRENIYVEAAALAHRLLDSPRDVRPLHGDLHHDNVIGGAGPWRVIDPKGLFGDPVFDVANIFRNPYSGDAIVFRPERIEGLATRFSERFGWERRRVLQWAAMLTAISAVWNRDSGNGFDWELRFLPLLLAAVDR